MAAGLAAAAHTAIYRGMTKDDKNQAPDAVPAADESTEADKKPREIGGPKGPEPTRYGDWEIGGRCTDF